MSSINISRFPLPKKSSISLKYILLVKEKICFLFKAVSDWKLVMQRQPTFCHPYPAKIWRDIFFYHVSTCFWGSKSTCLIPGSKRTKNESEKREEKCWSQNADQGTQSSPTRQGMRAEFNTEENAGRSAYHVFLIPRIAEWMSWSTFLKSVHRNHSFSLFLKMEF